MGNSTHGFSAHDLMMKITLTIACGVFYIKKEPNAYVDGSGGKEAVQRCLIRTSK